MSLDLQKQNEIAGEQEERVLSSSAEECCALSFS